MKKLYYPVIFLLLAFLSCAPQGIRAFWKEHSIDYSDIDAAEDQFAQFAELAVVAPEADALAALDALYDKLKKDTVAYYIYSDWMVPAFYSLLSPCRNVALFSRAVERIVADGIMVHSMCEPFMERQNWMQYNQVGAPATVPGLSSFGQRTLVLVLDLSCPTCRQALEKLGTDPQWADVRRVAVGCGYGPHPTVPGWEYLFPENASVVFDPRLTPVFFVVSPDGTVESSYALAL